VVHDLDEPRGQGAQWGEVQANIHRALGCAGVITDGSVRDLDEVRALGFQFAAAHISVSHAYVHMVDFGLPIKVGGLWVKPGDLIHADQHGAVTIPAEIAPRIPEAVVKVEADERKIISLCKSPTSSAAATGSSRTTCAVVVTARSPPKGTAWPSTPPISSGSWTISVSTEPSSWATRSGPTSGCASPRTTRIAWPSSSCSTEGS